MQTNRLRRDWIIKKKWKKNALVTSKEVRDDPLFLILMFKIISFMFYKFKLTFNVTIQSVSKYWLLNTLLLNGKKLVT